MPTRTEGGGAPRAFPRAYRAPGRYRTLRRIGRVLLAVVAFGLSGGCGERSESDGLPAPDFALERIGGGQLSLTELQGKLVLLDFWATWCVPCVKAIPELNAVYAARREEGVEVVGIAVEDLEADELAVWVADKGIEYPVVRSDSGLAEAYGAFEFPQHVLVSRDGKILEQLQPGVHTREELDELINRHLN